MKKIFFIVLGLSMLLPAVWVMAATTPACSGAAKSDCAVKLKTCVEYADAGECGSDAQAYGRAISAYASCTAKNTDPAACADQLAAKQSASDVITQATYVAAATNPCSGANADNCKNNIASCESFGGSPTDCTNAVNSMQGARNSLFACVAFNSDVNLVPNPSVDIGAACGDKQSAFNQSLNIINALQVAGQTTITGCVKDVSGGMVLVGDPDPSNNFACPQGGYYVKNGVKTSPAYCKPSSQVTAGLVPYEDPRGYCAPLYTENQPQQYAPTCSNLTCNLGYTPLEPLPFVSSDYYARLLGGSVKFGELLNSVYKILIALGSLFAVVMFVYAGIVYMSSEVVGTKADARSRLMRSLWGLLLLIGAWVILYTINPQLVIFNGGLNAVPTPTAPVIQNNGSVQSSSPAYLQSAQSDCLRQGKSLINNGSGYVCE
jgi:hypothetical protein